jgi:hypothetical protein
MQHLEVSGAVVLHIGRTVSKGETQSIYWHVVSITHSLGCTTLRNTFTKLEWTVTSSKEMFSSFLINDRNAAVSTHLVAAVCKLWNSSHMCDFLSSPVTWCFLGPGIFHTTHIMFCLMNMEANFTLIMQGSRTETDRFGQYIEVSVCGDSDRPVTLGPWWSAT